MDENDDAGLGHNRLLEIAALALEAVRDYGTGVAKEQAGYEQAKAGREQAIDAIARYGRLLSEGRALHGSNNNAFSDWVKAQKLDTVPPFDQRQERAAAQQIAEIAVKHAAGTVDGTAAVNPFHDCFQSRPTHIMRWWRARQPKPDAPVTEAMREVAPIAEKTAPAAFKSAAALPVRSTPAPPPDRVQKIADNAEFATLKKEVIDARAEIERLQRRLEAEQRKLLLAQRQTHIEIEEKAEARAGMIRQFAADKLREWAEAHAMFDVSEWQLLNMAIQKNATDETRHDAGVLLNERAFLATGGKMGKPDDIARAKRTRAEAMAERTAKAKATREANKAAKAADKPASDDTLH